MPSSIICTESIISSIPINLSKAAAPLRPRNAKIVDEAASKIVDPVAAINTAEETMMAGCFSENRITIEMALGPAISGIAMGTMRGASEEGSSIIRREGNSITKAIKKRTIPPASRSDCSCNPRPLSKLPPKNAATRSIAVAIAASRKIITRLFDGGTSANSAFNTTKFPKGSIIRNSSSAIEIIDRCLEC